MVVIFHVLVGMGVGRLVFTVDMSVGMGMGMLMNMFHTAVTVGVGMDVIVLVGVLQGNAVSDHEPCSCRHDGKPQIEGEGRAFPQNQHTEGHTEKGRDGVVGAGFRRAQLLLGHDVKIDAQTVSDKAEKQGGHDPQHPRDFLTDAQRDHQTS